MYIQYRMVFVYVATVPLVPVFLWDQNFFCPPMSTKGWYYTLGSAVLDYCERRSRGYLELVGACSLALESFMKQFNDSVI